MKKIVLSLAAIVIAGFANSQTQFDGLNMNMGNIYRLSNAETRSISPENICVQSVILNGKSYSKSYINNDDIADGGELIFVMGDHPSDSWGIAKDDLP